MIAAMEVLALGNEGFDGGEVLGSNGGKELLGGPDVDLFGPFADVDWVETSREALAAWIFFDEAAESELCRRIPKNGRMRHTQCGRGRIVYLPLLGGSSLRR